jgi:hypothetical protein
MGYGAMKYSLTIETDDPGEAGRILQVLQALGGGASPPEAATPQLTSVEPEAARMVEALTSPPLTSGQKIILGQWVAADPDEWVPLDRAHTYFAEQGEPNPIHKARGLLSVIAGRVGRAFRGHYPNMPRAPLRLLAEYRVDGASNSYRLTPLGREAVSRVLGKT